jgi:fructose-1,6-bisphosphatase
VESALGFTGETNVQGEAVKKMDLYANDVFISVFKQSGLVCRLASEEMEKPYYIPENCPIGRYTLLYDPVDGSSNVDINLNIGSIFSIRRQQGDDLDQTPATCFRMAINNWLPATFSTAPAPCWCIPLGGGFMPLPSTPAWGNLSCPKKT